MGHGETILVVEDNKRTREVMIQALRQLNYHPISAATGREAMACLITYGDAISLVVSDAIMPEMGVEEMLAAMESSNVDCPVIVVSGYLAPARKEALCTYPNFVAWLSKPIELVTLTSAIARTLATSGQSKA